MSVVKKSSAYPSTVQPGIPKLGALPESWTRAPLSEHLFEERRPMKMADDIEYDLVTVKRGRGGVVRRETKRGGEISVKSQFIVKGGDFLISKRQIVHGACGLVPNKLSGSIVSNEYSVLRGKPTIDLEFINHLSNSIHFQQTCFHSSIGVHIEKMIFRLDDWFKWQFDLPPLHEQKRITRVLNTWDQAIETVERLIANSEAQKKALMQQLLTDKKHLSGCEEEPTKLRLIDIAEVDRKALGKETPANFRFRYISLADVQDNRIVDNLDTVKFSNAPSRARRVLQENDILMATVRPNLQAFARVEEHNKDCIASTGFAVLSARKNYSADFLYHYLFGYHTTSQIDALVVGSSYPAISSSDVKSLSVLCPSLKEQQAIATILNNADASTNTLRDYLDKLKSEKSALMQQLLTGKRRVKVEEASAA